MKYFWVFFVVSILLSCHLAWSLLEVNTRIFLLIGSLLLPEVIMIFLLIAPALTKFIFSQVYEPAQNNPITSIAFGVISSPRTVSLEPSFHQIHVLEAAIEAAGNPLCKSLPSLMDGLMRSYSELR